MKSRHKFTFGLMPDSLKFAEIQKKKEKNEYEKLDLSEIKQVDFPSDQYYRHQTNKKQIVLHHTVSGQGADGDINWWLQTSSRIATHIIIDWKGIIHQCYSTKYWGHHLGVGSNLIKNMGTNKSNVYLNKHSIGVELDSWGGLIKFNRKWYPAKWDSNKVEYVANTDFRPIKNVQKYSNGYRGFYGYQKYTDAQLESARKLLVYWNSRYDIPLMYNDNMWDINEDALNGVEGIWTHTSFRGDKSDCHPQPELIAMLKSL